MASEAGANALHAGVSQAAVVLRCAALRCAALRCHWVREVVAGTALCHAMPSASGRAQRTAQRSARRIAVASRMCNNPRTGGGPAADQRRLAFAAADDEKDFAATTQRAFEHVVLEMMEE